LALGTYPDVSAADARAGVEKARKLLRDGVDPSDAKRQTKFKAALATESAFDKIAAKLVAKKRKGGTATVTLDKMNWILGKVRQDLGHRPIASIRATHAGRR
jgi:hypothetical protein